MSSPLLPPERMALLLATEQIKRRENPSPNITAVLIMALARLVDKLADEETQLQAIVDAWGHLRALQQSGDRDSSVEEQRLDALLDALIEEDT